MKLISNKERLFEIMKKVNKLKLNEDLDNITYLPTPDIKGFFWKDQELTSPDSESFFILNKNKMEVIPMVNKIKQGIYDADIVYAPVINGIMSLKNANKLTPDIISNIKEPIKVNDYGDKYRVIKKGELLNNQSNNNSRYDKFNKYYDLLTDDEKVMFVDWAKNLK